MNEQTLKIIYHIECIFSIFSYKKDIAMYWNFINQGSEQNTDVIFPLKNSLHKFSSGMFC